MKVLLTILFFLEFLRFPSQSRDYFKIGKNMGEKGPIYICDRDGMCFQERRRELSNAISKLWKRWFIRTFCPVNFSASRIMDQRGQHLKFRVNNSSVM
jgi:hypothetical protein